MAATRLLVGCSGWVYKDWRGRFYPDGLAAKRWLPFYARHFPTVEINGSFYRLPAPETFAAWRDAVPPGFVFAVKASRYLTHLKHLADPEAPIERLFASVSQLGPRLGPVLYQLPPRAGCRPPSASRTSWRRCRRRSIAAASSTWWSSAIHAATRTRCWRCSARTAWACACTTCPVRPHLARSPRASRVRFHGADDRYGGSYPDERLARWAEWLRARHDAGTRVYAYFTNDMGGAALENARTLAGMLQGT